MSRATRQPKQSSRKTGDALTEYLAALEEAYPAAKALFENKLTISRN